MLRVLTDDHDGAMSSDDFAFLTDLFDGRLNFHCFNTFLSVLLLLSPGDTAARNIVRGYFNGNQISYENFDIVHAELARDGSRNDMAVRELHFEDGIGESLHNNAIFKFDQIGFRQKNHSFS